MTKKRIKEFLTLMNDNGLALEDQLKTLSKALLETLREVIRLKHRCKHHCKCGARCFKFKNHAGIHEYKKHKPVPHHPVPVGFGFIHQRMMARA